jgi:hypothetical protein
MVDPVTISIVVNWCISVLFWSGDLRSAEEHGNRFITHVEYHSLGPYFAVGRDRKGELLTTEFSISLSQTRSRPRKAPYPAETLPRTSRTPIISPGQNRRSIRAIYGKAALSTELTIPTGTREFMNAISLTLSEAGYVVGQSTTSINRAIDRALSRPSSSAKGKAGCGRSVRRNFVFWRFQARWRRI